MLFLAKADRGIALPNPERLELSDEVSALVEFYEAVGGERTTFSLHFPSPAMDTKHEEIVALER